MKLHFKKFGDGSPVIILHGLFGFSDNWLTIGKELSTIHQVFLTDARNHGRSPHVEHIDYPHMVEDLYEFLTDFQLRKVILIGHSMGGKTAMNFTLEYPHRVEKLIVVDIAPKSYPILHRDILNGLVSINLNTIRSRSEADYQLANFIQQKKVRQFLLKNIYRTEAGRYAWRLNLDSINRHIKSLGSGIYSKNTEFKNPVLFVRGGNSEYILPDDEKLIKLVFPSAKIVTIPDASHWVHYENPTALLTEIKLFIA
jgi:esterase